MNEETKGTYCLILTPTLTQKLALLRDTQFPGKPLSFAGHAILDQRYKAHVESMIQKGRDD